MEIVRKKEVSEELSWKTSKGFDFYSRTS